MTKKILSEVSDYYTGKLQEFGPTPKGVDWKDRNSQILRYDQLYRLFETSPDGGIIDFGCGYGEFLSYLRRREIQSAYCGIDVSPAMVEAAKSRFADDPHARFIVGTAPRSPADYAVASGIFNVRLRFSTRDWEQYMGETLKVMNGASLRGFAFNCLTSYSDPEYRRDDLYYGDSCYWFDHCKKNFSRKVNLLHDYELYEFTIIVRK